MEWKSGKEIRRLFVDFWVSKGAKHYDSFSLVPEDPTLLFTIAGMVPFKKYYLGIAEPDVDSAVTSQKCVRTNDIDNVGRTARHHTFFEMLGNFSWGGYFKKESITWGWEFLTEVIGLDPDRMYATIYKDDEEAFDVWTKDVGLPDSRILRFGEDENFWFMGPQGPCGPDSEILYDQGPAFSCGPDCKPGCDCDRYLEIWNHVFTQYDRQEDGSLLPLPRKNIDTGMGLERLTSLVQGVSNDFETDLFRPIMDHVCDMAGIGYGDGPEGDMAAKVISDHIRAVSFMIADGILPSNDGQGYVLRRLLRRAARYGRLIGLKKAFLTDLIPNVMDIMADPYRELLDNRLTIEQVVAVEEKRFGRTLEQGSDLLHQEISSVLAGDGSILSGDVAFELYDTYGYPLELTREICEEKGLSVDEDGFRREMEVQRERARSSSKQANAVMTGDLYAELLSEHGATPFLGYDSLEMEADLTVLMKDGKVVDSASTGDSVELLLSRTPFYAERGGQVGDQGFVKGDGFVVEVEDTLHPAGDLIVHRGMVTSGTVKSGCEVRAMVDRDRREAITKNHTATHLLHESLIRVLGGHVRQNGSLVSDRFLRFDYTHFEPLSSSEQDEVELMVNQEIQNNKPLKVDETDLATAKNLGAKALFEEKYGDKVRVVSISEFSSELCGGVHVRATGEIGLFKIINDESIGSGIRRITAMTGMNAFRNYQNITGTLKELSSNLGVRPARLIEKIQSMDEENRELQKKLQRYTIRSAMDDLKESVVKTDIGQGVSLYVASIEGVTPDQLREVGDSIKDKDPGSVTLLISSDGDRTQMVCMVGSGAVEKGLHGGKIVKEVAVLFGGKGGGKPTMAQAGGPKIDDMKDILDKAVAIVKGYVK
ncbi:alanine--tRNA ligase [Dethiosulfovibrio sp. F2B]|uniref:alanine--tRNA ligase n=1 Tax=Dethiosulfovibrio faecalis TaxID=2720018 RepID=UPI001F0276BA|nr:alanine--tRNA ligase [Dethiosulfovibrio faecalis]MCF4150402.1 alanine--tRNA ligase [Dethiosulfovibrio faecalis]